MQLVLKLLKEKNKLKRHLDFEIEGKVAMTFYANKFKRSGSIQSSNNNRSSQPRPLFTFEQRQKCHMKILKLNNPPFTFEQRQERHMKILELNNQMKCFNCGEISH